MFKAYREIKRCYGMVRFILALAGFVLSLVGCAGEHALDNDGSAAGLHAGSEKVPANAFDAPYDDDLTPDAGTLPGMTRTAPQNDAQTSQQSSDAGTPAPSQPSTPSADAGVPVTVSPAPDAGSVTPVVPKAWYEGRTAQATIQGWAGGLLSNCRNPYYSNGRDHQTWSFSMGADGKITLHRVGYSDEPEASRGGGMVYFWDGGPGSVNALGSIAVNLLATEADFTAFFTFANVTSIDPISDEFNHVCDKNSRFPINVVWGK